MHEHTHAHTRAHTHIHTYALKVNLTPTHTPHQVAGLLGPACRVDKKGPHVADTEVGQGGTTQWKMCGLDADTSLAVFFEVVGGGPGQQNDGGQVRARPWVCMKRAAASALAWGLYSMLAHHHPPLPQHAHMGMSIHVCAITLAHACMHARPHTIHLHKTRMYARAAAPQGQQLFLQFITRYLHWSGALRCRVTTATRFWTDGSNSADLLGGFDQEAAAVVGPFVLRTPLCSRGRRLGCGALGSLSAELTSG